MVETVELREIRVFLTLAEELHFGRCAERLGLTQSRVSQSLRELEAKLGGQLFHRTSRTVALTPLGARFRDEAKPAYDGLIRVLERTAAANRSLEGTLRLGLLLATSGGPHLIEIITAFEERHPNCRVQIDEVMWPDALGPLQRGEIDVLLTRLPLRRPGLVVGPTLSREPRVLAVARDHPLATRDRVSIEDVADYLVGPISTLEREMKETLEVFIPRSTPSGRPIRRLDADTNQAPSPSELAALVARGRIVHPTVPSFAEHNGHPDIVYVPIADMPPSETGLVWWRRRVSDPRRREFVRAAREVLRRGSPVTADHRARSPAVATVRA